MNMTLLIMILVTLAIIAIVLAVVAMKLINKPPVAPTSAATPAVPVTPPVKVPAKSEPVPPAAKPESTPKTPTPVPKRADGEMEIFDISANTAAVLWTCPCCGAENTYGGRCQICAAASV